MKNSNSLMNPGSLTYEFKNIIHALYVYIYCYSPSALSCPVCAFCFPNLTGTSKLYNAVKMWVCWQGVWPKQI